jgi:tetratricopeptide (TPR) repeat protein
MNGRTIDGAYIEPEAYAAYTEGAYREARGEWVAAERAYRTALDQDPGSPGIWLRLGVLACRTDLARALDDFRSAETRGAAAEVSFERARCLHRHGQLAAARQEAEHAVQRDPQDGAANLFMAALYRQSSRPDTARHWLFAWLLLAPDVAAYRTELLKEVELLGDPGLSALANEKLMRSQHGDLSGGDSAVTPHSPPSSAPADVLDALRSGDLATARLRASTAGASFLDLALWAIESGHPDLGFLQAKTEVDANPSDPDAIVVALLAAHLSKDYTGLQNILHRAQSCAPPRAKLSRALTELLRSYAGDDAAERWRAAYLRLQPTRP